MSDPSLWDLYQSYRDLFSLEVPFAPDEKLVATDSDERTWSSLAFACIESENRVDQHPRLPASLDPAEITKLVQQTVRPTIQALIQPLIERAASDAAEQRS